MKNIFFILLLLLIVYSFRESYAQEKERGLRNPFLTLEEEMKILGISPDKSKERTVVPLERLSLSGIIYGDKKIAIINSEFYNEGDTIGDFTVEKIKPLSVVLKTERREYELKLKHVLAVSETKDVQESYDLIQAPLVKEKEPAQEGWAESVIEQLLGISE
ncbi:MAG: hypothetical protein PHQ54_00695 [Candidatus Omnitrophica bacterium]|nr:hypothetical protein [Candidatus Omnitrophota bacterium]